MESMKVMSKLDKVPLDWNMCKQNYNSQKAIAHFFKKCKKVRLAEDLRENTRKFKLHHKDRIAKMKAKNLGYISSTIESVERHPNRKSVMKTNSVSKELDNSEDKTEDEK